MQEYLKYLNTKEKELLKNYQLLDETNFNSIKNGDYVRYIIKKNLKFRKGGCIYNIVNNTIFIKNIRYNYVYPINMLHFIIFHKPHKPKMSNRDFMKYLLNGLENRTIKVTKKPN